ncbi:hypothetical protein D9758_001320 [Tetrapyrgos nigripes]|uniref:Uncharacterized protein n=1 Tax=Tetrapyrgos nigripes TaxID=182062 RepID=A0A8H5LU09_9AGAR|nr:hypothetical protein D9758_001320 [Tetrapyrgos nigripes]
MNKNPFVPQPSYTPQQPPLPPGPPPSQPGQPDYSAYWAAAQQTQPHPIPPYNQQWNSPLPPRPTPEQNALYANYGYGPQSQWQRQQHAHQHYHAAPPPPVPHGPPPAAQAYNPYQPGVYTQTYAPQVTQALTQPPYPQPPQPPSQPVFSPHIPPQPVQMMPHQQQPQQSNRGHHSSPQHQPPAKRQRFDGPSHQQPQRPPPTQPNFQNQPPSQPMGFNNRGGAPSQPGGGRGGAGGGRGGGNAGRGRGGSMNSSRGNLAGRSGRGGSFNSGSGGNAGRGGSAQPLRGHSSRGHLGGNKDFHNRRGGSSFGSGGSFSHQGSSSLRGRGQGHSSNRSQRHDGNTSSNFSKDTTMSSSSLSSSVGKKDENRRTLTDFKIVGLEIRDLSWTWGVLPIHKPSSVDVKVEDSDNSVIKQEPGAEDDKESKGGLAESASNDQKPVLGEDSSSQSAGSSGTTPQSRIRVYFHTPVTADDSHPIPHSFSLGSVGSAPSENRKGKRKKLDDEDDEDAGGRRKIPPPTHAHASDEISSVAGSIAETASEADWLMAAITEGDENRGHGENDIQETQRDPDAEETQRLGDDEDDGDDGERSHVHEIIEPHEGEDDGDPDGLYGGSSANVNHVSEKNGDVDMSGTTEQKDVVSTTPQVDNASAEANTAKRVDATATNHSAAVDHLVSSSSVSSAAPPGDITHPKSFSYSDVRAPDGAGNVDVTQVDDSSKTSLTSDSQIDANTSISTELDSASFLNSLQGSFASTQATGNSSVEHLPEPPASPVSVSNTLLSTSSSSTYGDSSQQSSVSVSQPLSNNGNRKTTRTPSANRLSISYAGGNRRLVIDAEVVETMKVFRSEGRIEVRMKLQQDADGGLKGVLVESLSEVTKSYVPFEEIASSKIADPTLPPFVTATLPLIVTLIGHLDTERPLSEPRWVKTGDIPDWLRSMFGRMFWVAGDAAEGWEKKITVVDPDPPPTIWTVLEGWAQNSPVGIPTERQRFLKTHLSETENLLEILLRLVRGERATAFSSSQTISAPSVSGPLLAALSQNTSHGAQQTHVSLAVMAIFQMTLEYAEKALGEKGASEVEGRIGEIIRCLPSHLIYKSLDGIFKEWRVEKKGR